MKAIHVVHRIDPLHPDHETALRVYRCRICGPLRYEDLGMGPTINHALVEEPWTRNPGRIALWALYDKEI